MTHDRKARIVEPPVFGFRVWLCSCGHRSPDPYSHVLHLEDVLGPHLAEEVDGER